VGFARQYRRGNIRYMLTVGVDKLIRLRELATGVETQWSGAGHERRQWLSLVLVEQSSYLLVHPRVSWGPI
jgi:hypothetical protein